jgi:hypothetical protein
MVRRWCSTRWITLSTYNVQKPTRNYPYQYQLQYTSPNGCNALVMLLKFWFIQVHKFKFWLKRIQFVLVVILIYLLTLSNYSISDEYTYQWYITDTTTVNAINGATLPTYHTVPTTAGSYTYWLLVDNYSVQAPSTAKSSLRSC